MTRLESDYYNFMGYDSDRSRDGLSHYVQFFTQGPVLELACGRGEFLDLLTAADLPAKGVDLDEGMVERARKAGHDVTLGDALAHLDVQDAGSLGGVFCAHFLEHLEPDDVAQVYAGAARALKPGGRFVAVVPSAASLSVLRYDFWRDPTHIRFYDPTLLGFFATQAGLEVTESAGNPRNDPGPPPSTIPMELTAEGGLGESVAVLGQIAQTLYPDQPAEQRRRRDRNGDGSVTTVADPKRELWSRLTHLVAVLDQRVQSLQHQNMILHTAYTTLLRELYAPSEVYVVATRPETEEGQ